MLWIHLTVRGTFDWPRLDYKVNLFWAERHETQERREEHNVGSNNPCNAMSTGDETFRLIHALSSQLLTDLLRRDLLYNMPRCVHCHGKAFPILGGGTLSNCNL